MESHMNSGLKLPKISMFVPLCVKNVFDERNRGDQENFNDMVFSLTHPVMDCVLKNTKTNADFN